MTLPVVPANQMSFSQINTELTQSSTAVVSLNDSNVRTLAGVGVSPAQIAITNLSGKSNAISRFVALSNANPAYSNDNGATWTLGSWPSAGGWNCIFWGGGTNGKFIAAKRSTNIAAYSSDGISWTQITLPIQAAWITGCYANNGVYVLIAANAAVGGDVNNGTLSSTDGITWTTRTPVTLGASWNATWSGNGRFVSVSNSNAAAMTSTDGITWTNRTMTTNPSWSDVVYGVGSSGGRFVAIAAGSDSYNYSTDGITWTAGFMPTFPWNGIVFGNNQFVAIGGINSTFAATSPNGSTWTQRTMPQGQWKSLAFGNGTYVAVGYSHATQTKCATSTDGINWTSRSLNNLTWLDVAYGPTIYPA